MFRAGEIDHALHEYEKALGVFQWIESSDPDWRTKVRVEDNMHVYTTQTSIYDLLHLQTKLSHGLYFKPLMYYICFILNLNRELLIATCPSMSTLLRMTKMLTN